MKKILLLTTVIIVNNLSYCSDTAKKLATTVLTAEAVGDAVRNYAASRIQKNMRAIKANRQIQRMQMLATIRLWKTVTRQPESQG